MRADQTARLLDAVPIALIVIRGDDHIAAANTAALSLIGKTIVGRHHVAVLRQPAIVDCVARAMTTNRRADALWTTTDANSEATYAIVAAPLGDSAEDGVLLSLQDVSHIHAADRIRRDFVANVSHELRSPLTALLGFIETLRGAAQDDPEARDRFLGIMQSEATRMSRLIRDLLSLARVESAERVRPTGQADIAGVLARAVAALAPLASDSGAEVAITGTGEGYGVPGDPDLLLQVFTNLIENAIKYGATSVAIEMSVEPRNPALRGPALRVSVRDNGDGIEPLHIPRLTERFYRVDSHRSREMGGTGLGLAIVKHIVGRHRGLLRIESTPGQGSCFVILLPCKLPG